MQEWLDFWTIRHSYEGAEKLIEDAAHIVCALRDLFSVGEHTTELIEEITMNTHNANYSVNWLKITIRICNRLAYIRLLQK